MSNELELSKKRVPLIEQFVKNFIKLSAFGAILISIAIVLTLSTEAINFFQSPEVTLKIGRAHV